MALRRFPISGELDLATAPALQAKLDVLVALTDDDLVLDCEGLVFIDSTGVAVLLEANQKLEADGRHLLILDVQRGPRLVFESLGLSDLLRFERESA